MKLELTFTCPLCGEEFSTPENLRRHRLTFHRSYLEEAKFQGKPSKYYTPRKS
jgi:hypothetical protein